MAKNAQISQRQSHFVYRQVQLTARRRRRSEDVDKLDPFKHLTLGITWHHLAILFRDVQRLPLSGLHAGQSELKAFNLQFLLR